jgi:hypothetical protein
VRSIGQWGVHGIETNGTRWLPTFLCSSGMAHGDEQATAAGNSRAAAARVCGGSRALRLGHGLGFQGRRPAYKGLGRTLGVCATHGEACLARTRRRRRSPGRSRRGEGDDMRVPRCQRLRAREGGGEERAGGVAGPTGPEGLLGRVLGGLARARQAAVAGLGRAGWATVAGCCCCCWAG